MEKERPSRHHSDIRGGFLNEKLTEYHKHVFRERVGLPRPGLTIVSTRGPFLVEEVTDLGLDEKGNWGFNVKGRLIR